MARMSGNGKSYSRYIRDSSQFTNFILDSVAKCHMKPQASDFIPDSLEYTDKYIEVADGHYVTANKKGQLQIKICDSNGNYFIVTLHNVIFALDICYGVV